MSFIQSYSNALETPVKLQAFINSRFDEVYDYYSLSNYETLVKDRDNFKSLAIKSNTIADLNFSNAKNEAYLNLILNTSVRLNEPFVFEQFSTILNNAQLEQSKVLKASAIFMNSRDASEFISGYNLLLNLLEDAYLTESDNRKEPIAVLINFYTTAILHFSEFNESLIAEIKSSISTSYAYKTHSFLADEVIGKVLAVSIDFKDEPFVKLKSILDKYLERGKKQLDYLKGFLIESGTSYAEIINSKYHSMNDIFQLNRSRYYNLDDKSRIFYSLGRGTNILEEEDQLTVYMSQLGPMHMQKLEDAFAGLPSNLKNISLFDWGCGQAPATKMFIEKYKGKISLSTLIEPSFLALKRAALHISNDVDKIVTINKKFDDLEVNDFSDCQGGDATVHIFSNVIDMEFFKLTNLVGLINKSLKGVNYFVVISPCINPTITQRVDTFVEQLMKSKNSELLLSQTKSKGNWIRTWTKVIRVFKIEL